MMPTNTGKRGRGRQRGVTLTEVVVSSTLLVVAIVPILKALTIAQTAGIVIERQARSLILAQGKLDEIRARSIYHYSDSFVQNAESLGGSYLCRVADDGNASCRTLTVSVGFDADGNSQLSSGEVLATLTTSVAKRWPGP
jgi:Tfp pilus assembly protein PilV